MTIVNFHERLAENKEWAISLLILSFVLIAIIRSSFETRFNDFMNLIASDKYIKIYKDSNHLMSWFTIVLFVVQLLSISFFVQLTFDFFGFCSKYDYLIFIRIFTILTVAILSKFLIEKIIGTAFDIEELIEEANLSKVGYRTYFAIVLLPINTLLYFNNNIQFYIFYTVFFIIFTINILIYLKSLKIYQNIILKNLFYFILYLCTLEIAPYYFIYYWFTKR